MVLARRASPVLARRASPVLARWTSPVLEHLEVAEGTANVEEAEIRPMQPKALVDRSEISETIFTMNMAIFDFSTHVLNL